MKFKRFDVVLLIGVALVTVNSKMVIAEEVAVGLHPPTSVTGYAAAGSNHGWQFTLNQNITLTHLGLYDDIGNGFGMEHQVGLWRLNDGTLLASGTMSAGTINPVLSYRFRYIDVPNVQLSIGVNYVVGFYSPVIDADATITKAGNLQINPAINLGVARCDLGGQFQMPANTIPTEGETPWDPPPDPHQFGPNFLFEIPEPCTLLFLGIGGIFLRRRK